MKEALPIIPCCEIAMNMALQDCRRDQGAHRARQFAEGYLRGAIGFLQKSGDPRTAYEIVQGIADEMTAEIIKQQET